MNPKVVDFVRKAVERGENRNDIYQKLVGIKLSHDEIMEAFRDANPDFASQQVQVGADKKEAVKIPAIIKGRKGLAVAVFAVIAAVAVILWAYH